MNSTLSNTTTNGRRFLATDLSSFPIVSGVPFTFKVEILDSEG